MPNDFGKKDNTALIHVAQTLADVAGGNPAYGLDKEATELIGTEAATLQSLGLQWVQQEAILRGLTDQKAAARAALISKLGMTAKSLEANPGISDAMLRAAALSARPSKGSKPTALAAPTGLTADGFSDSTLALKWTRTNRTRTGFVVETSPDGQSWFYVATTTRAGLSVGGYAPGQPVYVRVTAVNSTLSSPASNVASVYAPSAGLTLVRGGAETAKAA